MSTVHPPLESTLFPYTTLFRSLLPAGRVARAAARDADHRADRVRAPGRPSPRSARDRKSTRLNSSHVEISYAVFCLKKNSLKNYLRLTLYFQRVCHVLVTFSDF